MENIAKVVKVSDSKKSILVGVKRSIYSTGYDQFAWCANPNSAQVVGDELKGFNPTGTIQATDDKHEPLVHQDGSPVLRWVF